MSELFRLSSTQRRDPAVEAWLSGRTDVLGGIAREWFECLRGCGDDVREAMHDGCPTACIGDAAFGYVNAYTQHVNVGFFQGAALSDPGSLLEGTGKRMRHVKLRPGGGISVVALRGLILSAYRDMRERVGSGLEIRTCPAGKTSTMGRIT